MTHVGSISARADTHSLAHLLTQWLTYSSRMHRNLRVYNFLHCLRLRYRSGDLIFREGDPADCFYVLIVGRVASHTFHFSNDDKITASAGGSSGTDRRGSFSLSAPKFRWLASLPSSSTPSLLQIRWPLPIQRSQL